MNCEQLEPVYAAYLDGNVTTEERSLIDDHLRQCGHCRAVLAWTRHALRCWQDLSAAPSASFRERLRARLHGERRDA